MASFEYWVRTANNGAGHISVFGAPLAAGGGAGTEPSPWNSWVAPNNKILETGHATDDLIINFHPGCQFPAIAAATFQNWNGLGRGTSWRTITLRRDAAVVAAQPLYSNWRWLINMLQDIPLWTQGRIISGVWSAGAGDVYRTTNPVACSEGGVSVAHGSYLCMFVGVDYTDGRGLTPATIPLYCYTLADMSAAGDYTILTAGNPNVHLYIKTGVIGQNPIARWGNSTGFATYINNGRNTLAIRNPKGVKIYHNLSLGGRINWSAEAEGEHITECGEYNCAQRGQAGNGANWTISSTIIDAFGIDNEAFEPDLNHWTHPTTRWRGAVNSESGAQNGFHVAGKFDNFLITNLKVGGASHGGLAIEPGGSGVGNIVNQVLAISAQNTFTTPFKITRTGQVRRFRVTVTGMTAGRVTLQRATTSGGTYSDVKQYYENVDVDFNDCESEDWWYRLGVKTGDYSATLTVQNRWSPYPHNVRVLVTDYSDGKGRITGGARYMRGFLLFGTDIHVRGLRISKQLTQSQAAGECEINSIYWDKTCLEYSDPYGSANYNCGQHIGMGPTAYYTLFTGPWMPQTINMYGCIHDCVGGHSTLWDANLMDIAPVTGMDKGLRIMGGLYVDSNHARYRPASANATTAAYTRRRAPIMAYRNATSSIESYQQIKYNMFVGTFGGANLAGIAAMKKNGQSDSANATPANYPVIQYNENVPSEAGAGAVNWGGRVAGNLISATMEGFGFTRSGVGGADIVFVGPNPSISKKNVRWNRGYR